MLLLIMDLRSLHSLLSIFCSASSAGLFTNCRVGPGILLSGSNVASKMLPHTYTSRDSVTRIVGKIGWPVSGFTNKLCSLCSHVTAECGVQNSTYTPNQANKGLNSQTIIVTLSLLINGQGCKMFESSPHCFRETILSGFLQLSAGHMTC